MNERSAASGGGYGAEVLENGVGYRVAAPIAKSVTVEVQDRGGAVLRRIELRPEGGGRFRGEDADGKAGDLYRISIDGAPAVPDPASRWQPHGVHEASMVIDPAFYRWQDAEWRTHRLRDLVIYELHVGTFTPEGTFRAATERLEHLRSLGINAIQLMPIADFAGERNWGYDGVCLFAPSRAYGHPDDLRMLVDAAHRAGIAVILDVVYNHFGPDGNYLATFFGDYLDETEKTPWGGAIRYGEQDFALLRELVVSNPTYWMREFHIDGFRLDATHAIVDHSERHILKEMTASIHARGGLAIAEDARNEAKIITPESEGGYGFDAVWSDDFHHIVRVANTHESEGYLGDFTGSPGELADVLMNGWFYRGQATKSGTKRGTPCAHLAPECFVHCTENHDQVGNSAFGERLGHRVGADALRAATVLICTSPFTPMLFMGQEWDASTPFLFFTDHDGELGELIVKGRREEFKHFKEFSAPEAVERIPNPQDEGAFTSSKLNWGEIEDPSHAGMLALYRACLAIRRSSLALPTTKQSLHVEELPSGICILKLSGGSEEWMLLIDLVGGRHDEFRGAVAGGWQRALSSREARFGGDGGSGLGDDKTHLHFDLPETILLKRPGQPTQSHDA